METWFHPLILTGLILVAFWVADRLLFKAIATIGRVKQVPRKRYEHVYKYFRFILAVVFVVLMLVAWGIDYKGLAVLASSILAMLAVALVAQWSILSNVTAGVLIFFSFPARIGDKIEIIDGVNSLTGEIVEITLFQLIIKDSSGEGITYPNSLLLQKPVRIISSKTPSKSPKKITSLASRLKLRKPS